MFIASRPHARVSSWFISSGASPSGLILLPPCIIIYVYSKSHDNDETTNASPNDIEWRKRGNGIRQMSFTLGEVWISFSYTFFFCQYSSVRWSCVYLILHFIVFLEEDTHIIYVLLLSAKFNDIFFNDPTMWIEAICLVVYEIHDKEKITNERPKIKIKEEKKRNCYSRGEEGCM